MMSQLASGFSSANLRSFFSPMRKYLDASSMESVYFCQIGISFVFENGWLLAQLHGNFTPAHADGCGARCFAGVQCASIFDLPVCHRPQSAASALRPSVDRSLPKGRSWRTGRMARYRTECIRLPYAAPEASRRAFFVKEL